MASKDLKIRNFSKTRVSFCLPSATMHNAHKRRTDNVFTNLKDLRIVTPKRQRVYGVPKCTFEGCAGDCTVLLEVQCHERHLVCAHCLQDKFEENAHFVPLGGVQTLITRVVCPGCHVKSSAASTDKQCQIFPKLENVRGLHPQVCT